jgi:hypothetical protein
VKLPNLDKVVVPLEKITEYLLSEENSAGKAVFFIGCGFSVEQWHILKLALLTHATSHEVTRILPNPY